MKSSAFSRYALNSCLAAGLLAGCGGSQPPIGAPGAVAQTSTLATHADRGTSWMLPEAKSENLLYVTNLRDVTVYSYPQGKLVGKLKDFYVALGECVDAQQNVWIGDGNDNSEVQYAHGGSKPRRVLKNIAGIGCAIDPTTGNLALTTQGGEVLVYKHASGKPLTYRDPAVTEFWFCGYDDRGDLFATGSDYSDQKNFELVELPKGGSSLEIVKVNQTITYPGGVQWDGKHLAVGDSAVPVVYELTIRGRRGIRVGTTPLGKPAKFVYEFFVDGHTLIAPNNYFKGSRSASDVLYYDYPGGGSPQKNITKGMDSNEAAVVSSATR